MTTDQGTTTAQTGLSGQPGMWKFFVFSAVGAFMFFVPITVNDKSSIPSDHMVT